MKNKNLGKYISNVGKVIAVGGAILSIAHIIPSDGLGVWVLVIIGAALIFLGKRLDEE